MNLIQITSAALGSLAFRFLDKDRNKEKAIFIANIFFLFLLQPNSSLRSLNVLLPWATIFLILAVGLGVSGTSSRQEIAQIALFSLSGFLPFVLPEFFPGLKTTALDKNINQTVLGIFLLGSVCCIAVLARIKQKRSYLLFFLAFILVLFVILKQPAISTWASRGWRILFQQKGELASSLDLRWIGYSYIAFRLIHVIREFQKGRFQDISLLRFMNFCLFFPALSAGPIAKYDDFSQQMQQPVNTVESSLPEGGERLVIGLFKKFVLADSLALVALNSSNAGQITSTGWMWLALILYSLQIYFDFSGYTDIAIGLGLFLGIRLPENFDHPYLKSNLTKFWDSWHITLSQWIRAYFFNPLNRSLRKSKLAKSPNSILFLTQVSTMLVIGLWHGITWTFVVWGLWHGLGLFIQNRWSAYVRNHFLKARENPKLEKGIQILSTVGTFLYVSVGWVWFLSTSMPQACDIFLKLLGKGF